MSIVLFHNNVHVFMTNKKMLLYKNTSINNSNSYNLLCCVLVRHWIKQIKQSGFHVISIPKEYCYEYILISNYN